MLRRSLPLALALVLAATLAPAPSSALAGGENPEHGVFNAVCQLSHRAPDDPIVYPGQPGAAHSHDFVGNRSTDADSTYDEMVSSRTNCSRRGDRAAYWSPTLYQNGEPVEPGVTLVYYRTGSLADKSEVQPIPADLRVIAGSAQATGPQDTRIVSWSCGGDGIGNVLDHLPANCGEEALRLHFSFPNCWDGERLDSPDHKAHMAYAWAGDDSRRNCPSSHPVALPTLEFTTRWRIDGPLDGITLASGPIRTAHADFWNTWVQHRMVRLTIKCIRGGLDCRG